MNPILPLPRYDRWKAPAQDGQTLLWPSASDFLSQARDNHKLLSGTSPATLHGVPLAEARHRMRQWIGHADDDQLIFATGHQAELHHPGVWVKNVLIDAAQTAVGGRAIHFAVDTDEPKHLQLRWPNGSAWLTDGAPRGAWSGLVSPPSPGHLRDVAREFSDAANAWDFQPIVPEFLDSLRRRATELPNLPAVLTSALHDLDWQLGLRHEAMLVSPICLSEPYLLFVCHVLSRADEFAAAYNASLEEYRRENKISAAGRPMPNLQCTADGCEVPFWLDDLNTGTRQRAHVHRAGGHFTLQLPDGTAFDFTSEAQGWSAAKKLMFLLRGAGFRLSPRALTLTAVLRLLIADQFVHGIGGGQYDQVLDKLIARHWGIAPPSFSVTTATLFFPGAAERSRVCLPCIAREGHYLRHATLGEEKQKLVALIADAPRRSLERAVLFNDLHEKLAHASKKPLEQWRERFERAIADQREQKTVFDRELFYAIQPQSRLREMIDAYHAHFI